MGTPASVSRGIWQSRSWKGLDEVLVIEELDPVIETELLKIAGKYHLPVNIKGKIDRRYQNAGENGTESVREDLGRFVPEFMAGNQAEGQPQKRCPTSYPSSGAVRRMPAPGFFYAVKAGRKRQEGRV